MKQKIETLRNRFNNNYKESNKKTQEYDLDSIDEILNTLKE